MSLFVLFVRPDLRLNYEAQATVEAVLSEEKRWREGGMDGWMDGVK